MLDGIVEGLFGRTLLLNQFKAINHGFTTAIEELRESTPQRMCQACSAVISNHNPIHADRHNHEHALSMKSISFKLLCLK